jgi:glycosyltransferase involved in cell wall biosynthesis
MSKKIKVLHFSTHHENCGIGKYQEMFLEAMEGSDEVENTFFETSPNQLRTMRKAEKEVIFNNLRQQLQDYDILHIQHEFSFLHSLDFPIIASIAKELNKKLVMTIHTSPTLAYEKPGLSGVGPRSIVRYLKMYRRKVQFNHMFTDAVVKADVIIVHNTATLEALVDLGVERERIKIIVLPVPSISHKQKNSLISEKLNRQPRDIIMATTGFLHQFKGIDQAIKALVYLPSNYKLAIIGGMHIDHDPKLYNDIADLIRDLKLQDRVYITGYIEDDTTLNAMIRDCDICVYPYDRKYYSNISSASLNNGFANHKPVIVYPTTSFIELNDKVDAMILTGAFAYYELAREVERVDLGAASEKSKQFSIKYSYPVVAKELEGIYVSVDK